MKDPIGVKIIIPKIKSIINPINVKIKKGLMNLKKLKYITKII